MLPEKVQAAVPPLLPLPASIRNPGNVRGIGARNALVALHDKAASMVKSTLKPQERKFHRGPQQPSNPTAHHALVAGRGGTLLYGNQVLGWDAQGGRTPSSSCVYFWEVSRTDALVSYRFTADCGDSRDRESSGARLLLPLLPALIQAPQAARWRGKELWEANRHPMEEVPEGVQEASSNFRVPGAPSFWAEGACFDRDWPELRPTRPPLKDPEETTYYSEYA